MSSPPPAKRHKPCTRSVTKKKKALFFPIPVNVFIHHIAPFLLYEEKGVALLRLCKWSPDEKKRLDRALARGEWGAIRGFRMWGWRLRLVATVRMNHSYSHMTKWRFNDGSEGWYTDEELRCPYVKQVDEPAEKTPEEQAMFWTA